MDVKQAVGLFLRQLPDEIALEDHETVDDALVRLRKSLQNMNSSNPTFWKLSLVTRMKDLVRDNMSSTIEDAVELAMQEDPTWMLLPSNDGDSPLDAFVDDILAKNPVGFVKVQRQLSDKVSADVRSIMEYIQKHVKSGADLQQLFTDSANDVINVTAETKQQSGQQPKLCCDAQVFNLDNLGDDEWGDAIAPGDDRAAAFSLSPIIDKMKQAFTAVSRADVLRELEHTSPDCIVQADGFFLFCIALVPMFFHSDSCDRALVFFWKVVHVVDDCSIQCSLFVDLIATLLALPQAHLCLRKQSLEPSPPPAHQHPPHHHADKQQRHHQVPLLNVCRLVFAFLQLLPATWIYVPNELRTNVMLSACQFLAFSVDDTAPAITTGHGGAAAAVPSEESSKPLPPSSLLAYMDASSHWFTYAEQWHLRSPLKEQWLRVVVQSGLVTHVVARLVFAHETMGLWRKIESQIQPHNLSRRRSAKSVAHGAPKHQEASPHIYDELHRRMLVQTTHMLLTLLPFSTVRQSFPVVVTNPFMEPPAKQSKRPNSVAMPPPSTHEQPTNSQLEADEATNNLIYQVKGPSNNSPTLSQPDAVNKLSVPHDVVCLHVILMSVVEGWTADVWTNAPAIPTSCASLVASLVKSMHNYDIYLVLFDVLTAVLSETGESAPLLPRDFGEFRFPYEVANNISAFLVEPAKSLLVQFVAHLIPRMPCQANDTNVAKDARILSNIKEIILPLLIDAVTALPPSKASCERMATLVCAPWCSTQIVHAVARCSAHSSWWIVHFHKFAPFQPALRAQIAQVNGNASRATVVSNLCATAVGLLYYHDLLFDVLPLESLWEPLPSHRSLFGICQLANVPAVATAWLESCRRQSVWRNAINVIREDVHGLDAVYGSLVECPFHLRVPVHEWWHFRRLCSTPYAATATFSIGDITTCPSDEEGNVDSNASLDGILQYLTSVYCFDTSATSFRGCQVVSNKYLGVLNCTCDCVADSANAVCILDPSSWMIHSVRQFVANVGGALECKRVTSMDSLPSGQVRRPPTSLSPSATSSLHQCMQQVLGSIDATTSYLDFVDHVNDSFWRFLACFDSECMSTSTPEYTKWFGDILWAIVCTGKSRWRQDRSSCPPTKTSAGQTNASTLHWANSWTKAFSQSSENLENAVGCSTLLRKVFQAFGDNAADPFVWTCVTMLSERKLDTEVLAFFTALHSSANSMYVWPLQLRATTTINTPMVRVAAAVEMILHLDFPHIALALRRLECPVLSLVLRWQHACFWNVLNWGEIMGFVTLACLHGVEAVVFLHLIVLHHVSTYQLNAITTGDELLRLQIQPRLTWSTYESLFNRLREAHYELVADLLNEQPQ
ncbi:hypothetical protein H310_07075 [Aphanomyces invadans]|uniref:BROMI C-terminal Rab TBC-like domain-containing protein n=1 Tax=Aphanomyces invadans TaxID=157072 RepID=A0A024U2M6_9STRA|nr:hypothetical protein H310_07075 [Aphanomyces invadans]ETW00450.1 hypothetical protein H310_07075 [Aphanomyces invadans]|eukprot:XP_008870585.1 hypothetical protein H310_07075 [Aphanomyces invadans]